jgi:acetylornithine deacetylase/succinyl-diaminopimelate desuccinylase-like protein
MNKLNLLTPKLKTELVEFAQSLVRTKSLSGQEEEIIRLVERKMLSLGFDEVSIDSMGNVLGRIGSGEKKIMFDSHVDTVASKMRRCGMCLHLMGRLSPGDCMAAARWI